MTGGALLMGDNHNDRSSVDDVVRTAVQAFAIAVLVVWIIEAVYAAGWLASLTILALSTFLAFCSAVWGVPLEEIKWFTVALLTPVYAVIGICIWNWGLCDVWRRGLRQIYILVLLVLKWALLFIGFIIWLFEVSLLPWLGRAARTVWAWATWLPGEQRPNGGPRKVDAKKACSPPSSLGETGWFYAPLVPPEQLQLCRSRPDLSEVPLPSGGAVRNPFFTGCAPGLQSRTEGGE